MKDNIYMIIKKKVEKSETEDKVEKFTYSKSITKSDYTIHFLYFTLFMLTIYLIFDLRYN